MSTANHPITKILEEVCKRPEAQWSRAYDSSIIITYKNRTFRITAEIHEDTGTALLHINEDIPNSEEE